MAENIRKAKAVKSLRSGYTTGTCAAAAAKAALHMLLSGQPVRQIDVTLPDGKSVIFPVKEIERLPDSSERDPGSREQICCAVEKDAGDDPDVTNGVLVRAAVSRQTSAPSPGILTDKPCYFSEEYPFLSLTGGEGIGIVTRKGLACEPGFYAINPAPRAMIFKEAAAVCRFFNLAASERFLIELSIPEGISLADRTFNPKLGIKGGISVLGTSGIVNPMSEQALVETIRLEIRVKAREGRRILAVAPGNYGEAFLQKELDISMDSFVKCSNFIGETFLMMKEESIEEVLLAGHAGKLIKVAAGKLNTHSQYGDGRMESFYDCAQEAGMQEDLAEPLLLMNTAEEAVEYLGGKQWLDETVKVILSRIQKNIEAHSGILPEVVIFSGSRGLLGMTQGAKDLAGRLVRTK